MQRRKLSDDESDDRKAPSRDAPKFRIVRRPEKKRTDLSTTDLICVSGVLFMLVCVPLYAIASSMHHGPLRSSMVLFPGDARSFYASTILSNLYSGGFSGRDVAVAGWQTQWADENRSQLEQVVTRDLFTSCQSMDTLNDAAPGMRVCVDGEKGSFPAAGKRVGRCTGYSFSLTSDGSSTSEDLRAEREMASRGCDVHVFSPLLTLNGKLVSADLHAGTPAIPAPPQGSLTLHAILGAAIAYDPTTVSGRHPETLRPEQTWTHLSVAFIMRTLGHHELNLLRVKGMEGREWPLLHDCLVTSKEWCSAQISQLSVEFTLVDTEAMGRGGHSPDGGVELATLASWAATLGGLAEEQPLGQGFKQVDRAGVNGLGPSAGGSVSLGLSPQDPRFKGSAQLAAAFASSTSTLYDGRVARGIQATYVRRSLDDIVRVGTHDKFTSATAYTAARLDAFCEEGTQLAKAEYGPRTKLNSPQCPNEEEELEKP